MFDSAIAVRKWPQAVHKQIGINKTSKILFIKIGGRLDLTCQLWSVLKAYRYER